MKLFTKYTRVNLWVMVILFGLSACSIYILTNYVLANEMDADLGGIRDRILTYVHQNHQLPTVQILDEEQVDYKLADQAMNTTEFTPTTLYSKREKKMHNFRQMVFTVPV